MPVFKNQENKTFVLLPAGDYVFCVVGFESGLQTGGKTAGSPFWELKMEIEGKGANIYERLIDHPSCDWKIDTFLKSANASPAPGAAFEFDHAAAEASGAQHVDVIGLRGWCAIIVEEFTKTGTTDKLKRNKVSCFYTNKPKLPRRVMEQHQPEPAHEPDPLADPLSDGPSPF